MRGRKPKPLGVRAQEGDVRKVGANKLRERIEAEPTATCSLPPCPRHLKGLARSTWKFWVEEIEVMGLDRRPDAQMLEGACVNYARAVAADKQIEREGLTVTESTVGEGGEVVILKIKAHPAVAVSNAAWRQLRAFASEFGLSPVSRTRLAVEKKDSAVEDLAAILTRPREQKPSQSVQ